MNNESLIKDIVREGIVFGHKRRKTHPKMRPFIAGTKNEIELLNPENSLASIIRAGEFLKEKKAQGSTFFVVGTRPAAKRTVEVFAKEFGFPYVTARWLGGTLTNFSMIGKRIAYYEGLIEKNTSGAFEKYTKKEQRQFLKEIEKMKENFEGIRSLKKIPEVLLFVDENAHQIALHEARLLKIPTVGIIDTNDDPSLIDYPIFANDHSVKSIEWVFRYLSNAIK